MDKREKLELLKKEMEADDLPLKGEANLVFGEGDFDCSIMFVGEAPGANENEQKRPFVGRAGKLLDQLITEISWKQKKKYLACKIEIINPKIIATLGRFSMNYFLPLAKISRDHGKIFEITGRIIFPLYHPAAALRATAVLNDLRADFKKLPNVISGKIVSESIPIATPTQPKKNGPSAPQGKLF